MRQPNPSLFTRSAELSVLYLQDKRDENRWKFNGTATALTCACLCTGSTAHAPGAPLPSVSIKLIKLERRADALERLLTCE